MLNSWYPINRTQKTGAASTSEKGRGLLPGSRLFWLYINFCFLVFKDLIKGIPQGVLCNLHRRLYRLP